MSTRATPAPRCWALLACALAACAVGVGVAGADAARAQSTWRLEQPDPPPAAPDVPEAPAPVGLGRIGDIEFEAPDRGVLITAGNPPTIPAGVWAYNGRDWHELANVCGGTEGRIAWAGPEEFWTISDARPGQADVDGKAPPREDDTLCRFAEGKVVESFAAPAYEADSYQPMQAAACLSAEDCWFAGDRLPAESPEIGAFQLHWNGSTLTEAPYLGEGHAIEDMRAFKGRLYASVKLLPSDPVQRVLAIPPALHVFDPEAAPGFMPEEALNGEELYAEAERPTALGFLRLSAGAGGLWAATGEEVENAEILGEPPKPTEHQQVTVLRYTPLAGGEWTQLLGPRTPTSGEALFPGQTVETIAAEPGAGEEQAWLGLQTLEEAQATFRRRPLSSTPATVAHISADGAVSAPEILPNEEGVGPKGAAYKLTCPAAGDCWLATTEGWLFHLAPEGERTLPEDTDPNFAGLITERPLDRGLPQTPPDSLPPEDSGQLGEAPIAPRPTVTKGQEELRVPVALVSGIHTRLVHGTTLELRLRLAVKARIQLVAKRKHRVVAKTATYTFKAGEHKLLLTLNRKRWPTELHLVEHALAPLPTVSAAAGTSESLET
jgi:hypothetical protein